MPSYPVVRERFKELGVLEYSQKIFPIQWGAKELRIEKYDFVNGKDYPRYYGYYEGLSHLFKPTYQRSINWMGWKMTIHLMLEK